MLIDEVGETTEAYELSACGETISLADLQEAWEAQLEPVFPYRAGGDAVEPVSFGSATPLTYNCLLYTSRCV